MTTWALIYYAVSWTIILVMIPVVLRRRHPAEAMTWLLLIVLQPILGLGIYLLIGENRLPIRRIKEHAQAVRAIEAYGRLAVHTPEATHPQVDPVYRPLIHLAELPGVQRQAGVQVSFSPVNLTRK